MLRGIPIIVGGIAIAIALPIAALALTTGDDSADDVEPAGIAIEADAVQAQTAQNPTYEPQRLRVHADTGRPEGFEPLKRRLHQSVGTQPGGATNPEAGMSRGMGNPGGAVAQGGAGRGQAGDCLQDGECVHEDGQTGPGSRGPGGNRG